MVGIDVSVDPGGKLCDGVAEDWTEGIPCETPAGLWGNFQLGKLIWGAVGFEVSWDLNSISVRTVGTLEIAQVSVRGASSPRFTHRS